MAHNASHTGFGIRKSGILIGCITAVLSTIAIADVAVTVGSSGYNDFFKRCDIKIETQRDAGIADTTVIYRVLGGAKGAQMCARQDNGGGCRGELEDYTCEDVTGIDVYAVTCEDADGALTNCGAISASAGDGLSVPVNLLRPAAPADTTIYAMLGGFDDFFDRCGFGLMYSSKPEVKKVELDFNVAHSGGVAECSFSLNGHGGTGSSCFDEDEFTCDAVEALNVTRMSCHDDAGETDCGSVGFSAAEPGLIKDSR